MLSTHHCIFGGLIRIFSFSNTCGTYSVSVTAVSSFKVRKGYSFPFYRWGIWGKWLQWLVQDHIAGEWGWSQDLNLGGPAPTTGLWTSVFCYLPIIVMTIVITAFIYWAPRGHFVPIVASNLYDNLSGGSLRLCVTDEETEAQREKSRCPAPRTSKQ